MMWPTRDEVGGPAGLDGGRAAEATLPLGAAPVAHGLADVGASGVRRDMRLLPTGNLRWNVSVVTDSEATCPTHPHARCHPARRSVSDP